ncbi:MAG: hypothetical protein KatS3mg103_0298 [Phycisphaerales bacterium]|nr:MAG: hypothetical protein KatS3mg103_0298 [Phycisphaerales bacterium]
MPFEKDVLTTGEVAEICKVAPRTVSKWFDSGELEGYRIPGSKDRRIPLPALIKFMKKHKMPLDGLKTTGTRVLIVDADSAVTEGLGSIIAEQTDYEVYTASTSFQAGMLCEKLRPHVLLIDVHLGDNDAHHVVQMIRANDHLAMTRIVAMSNRLTDGQAHALKGQGFDAFLRKPFPARDALRIIEAMTSMV